MKNDTKEALKRQLTPYLKSAAEQLENDFFEILFKTIKYNCPEDARELLKLSEQEQVYLLAKIDEYVFSTKKAILNAEAAIKKSLSKTKRLREKLSRKKY